MKLWGTQTTLTGNKTNIKVLRTGNVRWEDLRSMLGGAGSLRNIASSFSVPLTKGDFDFSLVHNHDDAKFHQQSLLKYLEKDVMLLPMIRESFMQALKLILPPKCSFDKNDFSVSLSSFVLKRYFKHFTTPQQLKNFISTKHHDRDYFRQSYHGGRVAVPQISIIHTNDIPERIEGYINVQTSKNKIPTKVVDAPLYYVDINSSYPYIMTKHMPCG